MDSNNNKQKFRDFWHKYSGLIVLGSLVAVVGTSLWIMSTFSRNTSTMQSTDTATVAKFLYEIKQTEKEDTELMLSGKTSINIFDTAADTGINDNANDDRNGNDVNSKYLAPGTAGYFEFIFRNLSRSAVKVTFDNWNYSETNTNGHILPIIFYFNGKYYSDLYSQTIETSDSGSRYGKDWVFYFNEDDAKDNRNGITLTGDLQGATSTLAAYNLRHEINNFATNSIAATTGTSHPASSLTFNAASFLNYTGAASSADQDYVKLAWFYPFEARFMDSSKAPIEDGTDPGSGFLTYKYDDYCQNFVGTGTGTNAEPTATMEPIIRVSQIDEYATNNKNKSSTNVDNHGWNIDNWFRRYKDTEITWGEDA